ncbi:MAG: hypothetical protein ACHQ7H_00800 [Candidatus Rokuibacteriota bacterium]|jgi:hypothetical protein
MNQIIAATLGFGFIVLGIPALGQPADQCPPELTQAKAALKSAQVAKEQEIQAPRSPKASARAPQDVQAPRTQDIQAPRGQEIQAPRSQQEIPVPRGQEIQAPRVKQAGGLVHESEAACKTGDMALSTRKAKEALGLLKK